MEQHHLDHRAQHLVEDPGRGLIVAPCTLRMVQFAGLPLCRAAAQMPSQCLPRVWNCLYRT
jgi:hypothetical protein